ncbi:MAG: deoxyribodipyrimidine photo-lyase, partial [Gammaproteobacteria bacterium]
MTDIAIHWFRLDLRLRDNPALRAAAQHSQIIPLYICDTSEPGALKMGGASQWWLHHSLKSLNSDLDDQLVIYRGDPEKILMDIAEQTGASHVYWNRGYEPHRINQDMAIKVKLKQRGVNAISHNGRLLWEPMTVLKADQTPYKV